MSRNALNNTRQENFSEWYQEIVAKAELADSSSVRGSMVIRPYGYAIWELIRGALDSKIKAQGVQNAYFPLLIPLEFFEKEAEHVDGFAKECAVVTHHRLKSDGKNLIPDGKLEKPYIIRPTSETIIGESFSKWVQSYKDLPLKVNQWANVLRWEMRPRIFLRTSEFLWQEGHTVFATLAEAEADARKMLDVYNDLFLNYLAIQGVAGKKTEDEKFPGAVNTYTIEAMMQDGKALQSCTSHNLGQNFTRTSNITFSSKEQVQEYAYSASWGASTRMMGAVIMSHSDDDGLVLPPEIAPHQVVIIPIIKNDGDTEAVMAHCEKIKQTLGCRVIIDNSAKSPQDKKWDWIRKGAPIRMEIGAREAKEQHVFFARRDKLEETKTMSLWEFYDNYPGVLKEMQKKLLEQSKKRLAAGIIKVEKLGEIEEIAKNGNSFISIPKTLIGDAKIEEIKEKYALSFRCMPFNDSEHVILGKSY